MIYSENTFLIGGDFLNIGYVKKEVLPYRMIDKIRYFLGMVTTCQFEQGYIFKLPIFEKEKKVDKVVQSLLRQISKAKIDTVVFSNEIVQCPFYFKIEQELNQYGKKILNGRKLMKYMDYDIFEYILNLQKADIQKEEVFFLIKKDRNLDLQFLSRFIEKCKTVNIITNDIEKFKEMQTNLYEKENILIGVSNNKNKSLKRAKYIFNINMDKRDLEKFKMNRNAMIINFDSYIQYNSNTFDGINVNYFQIDMPDEYIEKFEKINEDNEFDKVKLYEGILLKEIEIEKKKTTMLSKSELAKRKYMVQNIINRDGIKITGLIGNNGRIDEREIICHGK